MGSENATKDYSKGKIYVIKNDINDDKYIGSTIWDLERRLKRHILDMKCERRKNYKFYQEMAKYGTSHYFIELVENYPCETVQELKRREGHFIKLMGTLNTSVAGRTEKEYKKEYLEKHKEYFKQKNQEYNKANKDIINEKKKIYYQNNKQHLQQKKKEYMEKHKEYFKQKEKERREAKKEELAQKRKEYYERTKEQNKDKLKEYRDANKDRINERARLYREANRELIRQKQNQKKAEARQAKT